jgi:protein TonB
MISIPVPKLTRRDYGAFELRNFINIATQRGFIVTMGLILLLLLIQFAYKSATTRTFLRPPKIQKITLADLPPPETETPDTPPPPPPPDVVFTGAEARAGTPVPIPEAEMAPDMRDFANVDDLAVSSSSNDAVVDMGQFNKVDVNQPIEVVKEEEPDPGDFIAVDQEPDGDFIRKEILRNAVYPAVAQRANMEGTVTLQVLIGKDGRIRKTRILNSTNEIFEKAAQEAAMKVVATPALQGNKPLEYWMTIPVRFTLRN